MEDGGDCSGGWGRLQWRMRETAVEDGGDCDGGWGGGGEADNDVKTRGGENT